MGKGAERLPPCLCTRGSPRRKEAAVPGCWGASPGWGQEGRILSHLSTNLLRDLSLVLIPHSPQELFALWLVRSLPAPKGCLVQLVIQSLGRVDP